jgi:hypothetical protein
MRTFLAISYFTATVALVIAVGIFLPGGIGGGLLIGAIFVSLLRTQAFSWFAKTDVDDELDEFVNIGRNRLIVAGSASAFLDTAVLAGVYGIVYCVHAGINALFGFSKYLEWVIMVIYVFAGITIVVSPWIVLPRFGIRRESNR